MGDAPYGSLLADADGAILIEAHNTVRRDNDIAAHPELKLARWAARELDPESAARTTMYTSCQPCGMCAGGIVRSGLGRVVYALSSEQFAGLNLEPDWPTVAQEGRRSSRKPAFRWRIITGPGKPPARPGRSGPVVALATFPAA